MEISSDRKVRKKGEPNELVKRDPEKTVEPMVKIASSKDHFGVPVRGPRNALQAQISAHIGAASFASFASFDVPEKPSFASFDSFPVSAAAKKGETGGSCSDADKMETKPVHAIDQREPPSVVAAGRGADAKEKNTPGAHEPCKERVLGAAGPPAQNADDEDLEGQQDAEEKGINRTPTVRRYLEKMRGTGSKETSGDKKDKKEKKDSKDKVNPDKKEKKDSKEKIQTTMGPQESKKKMKEKKKKEKEQKKIQKARKKEEKRERAIIAADRETKRIFGRDALVISSSSSDNDGADSRESI